MDDKAVKTVNFPAPPSSWDELDDEQLRFIFKLQQKQISMIEYKLQVFLHLMGLKVLNRADKKEDGSFTYHFRRKGLGPFLRRERLDMEAWEVDYWIKQYMEFLFCNGNGNACDFCYRAQ